MLLEAESIFPLFYENATEAYLAGCAVLNNNTGEYRRQLSLPMVITLVDLLKSSMPLTLSSLGKSQTLGIFKCFMVVP